jgi:hypothetical protein
VGLVIENQTARLRSCRFYWVEIFCHGEGAAMEFFAATDTAPKLMTPLCGMKVPAPVISATTLQIGKVVLSA